MEQPVSPHLEPQIPKEVVSYLHRDVWAHKLSFHPDKTFADEIINYIDYGTPLLYEGPVLDQEFPNWKSCDVLRQEVKSSLLYDVSRRWKVGPFPAHPFECFVSSPMGAFSKLSNNRIKTRVIHDLSWPPGRSVNFFIPAEPCSVHYVSILDAVKLVKQCGRGCLMGKLDLQNA
jgi:hypothetical protein